MTHFEELKKLVKRKKRLDAGSSWSEGSSTYVNELKKEVDEVIEEIPQNRLDYLEDELCDVLWDYMNLISCLEEEQGVSLERVIERAVSKYTERLDAIDEGMPWKEIKEIQKKRMAAT